MKKKFLIITTIADSLPFFKGQIDILKRTFDIELVSSSGARLDEMCLMHDVKKHEISMKREIAFLADFVSLFKLIILFLKARPEVVHSNTPKAGLLSTFAAWITRVPCRIYYIHGLRYHGESGFKKKILIKMEVLSCYFSTDIIAVSQGIKKTLIEDRITKKKILIIGHGSVNGIDVAHFNPNNISDSEVRKKYNIDEKDFVFGFIGRLVGDKGINELISAFVEINKLFKTKLVLLGKFEDELDPLQENTLKLIQGNSNILQVGFIEDVRPYLKAMNVFVFPSYREGFGIVLMEATAMGVPCISSNIIGCNEIIIDGENGYLIQSKNEKELYEKMLFCIQNPSHIEEMSYNTRDSIINKFEQQAHWAESLDMYEKITQKRYV